MSLKEQLQEDLKEAMRKGDEARKTAIRMALLAIRMAEVEAARPLREDEILRVLQSEVKRRRETLEELERAHRPDRLAAERAELEALLAYLPQPLTREEIEGIAREAIAEIGAASPAHLGEVMKRLMPRIRGRADGREVQEIVRRLLAEAST
ncbi:MAG: GatB/YqeY domain-containing protein [Anaerolineae bacterium]|nr:GatB/YqeY domain-containing protein [Thermoflexus sp.]MDW8064025.1 GatB/YqeY domain-containing protein [Anaerolineae bacterium]